MKNFPDQDPFNELEKRLQGYSEEPDDLVWQNVDKALRPRRTPVWIPWIGGAGTLAAIVVVTLMFQPDEHKNDVATDEVNETHVVAGLQKESATTKSELAEQKKTEVFADVELDKNSDHQKNKIVNDRDAGKNISRALKISLFLKHNGNDVKTKSSNDVIGGEVANSTETNKNEVENRDGSLEGKMEIENDSLQVVSSEKESETTNLKEESVQSKKRIPKRGLTFYTSLTPQLSFQRVIPKGNDGVVISDFYNPSIISSDRFGFGLEAGIQGHLSKHWEYYGGLSYYQQNQTLTYAYQTDRVSLETLPDNGYIVTPESDKATVKYSMRNWGGNIGLMYNLQGKKLAHKIGTGVSYQKGFNKQTSEKYNNSESSYLFYTIFYRNEVRLNSKWRVYVQPTFMHSFYTKEQIDAPFTLKPYRAGISFGILFDL